MRLFALITILALAVPAAALAKGASEATIQGPGLGGGLAVPGSGEDGGASPLGRLAELAGFFPAVFSQTPDPMLRTRPQAQALGPRYTIRYVMPGPAGVSVLRQELYPYARPFPLSYTRPGQTFSGGQRTVGGWYVSSPALRRLLVRLGLPATPASPGSGGTSWSDIARLAAVTGGAALLLAVGALLAVRRRRVQVAPQ